MLIFSEITVNDCVKQRYLHSKEKIRLVQHCAAISATAELLLGVHRVMCVGLSLVINIQQDQYVSESGNTAGIISRVVGLRLEGSLVLHNPPVVRACTLSCCHVCRFESSDKHPAGPVRQRERQHGWNYRPCAAAESDAVSRRSRHPC